MIGDSGAGSGKFVAQPDRATPSSSPRRGEVVVRTFRSPTSRPEPPWPLPPTHVTGCGSPSRDTGIGIPAEKRASHLRTRSSRPTSSTTRKYGGTGLGLAISSQAGWPDGRHYHAIDQGTPTAVARFQFEADAGQVAAPRPRRPPGQAGGGHQLARAARVLVVDDNAVQPAGSFCKSVLTQWGMPPRRRLTGWRSRR